MELGLRYCRFFFILKWRSRKGISYETVRRWKGILTSALSHCCSALNIEYGLSVYVFQRKKINTYGYQLCVNFNHSDFSKLRIIWGKNVQESPGYCL